jgi:hypothetical protein
MSRLFVLQILLSTYLLIIPFSTHAQVVATGTSASQNHNGLSIGFQGGMYATNQALVFVGTTPYKVNHSIAFRITAGLQWLESYRTERKEWVTFPFATAGIVYRVYEADRLIVVTQAGYVVLFPTASFSSERVSEGFYGTAGLELFFFKGTRVAISYTTDIGLIEHPGRADKLEYKPRYSSGLTIKSGLNFYF